MKKAVIFVCILCFALVSCTKKTNGDVIGENTADQNAIDVSIIELIASPSDYDGKLVRVIGVGNLEFEGNSIYISEDDWKNANYDSALWIELDGKSDISYENVLTYNGKYVIIEGIFDKDDKGHLGAWPCAVSDINRYELWE